MKKNEHAREWRCLQDDPLVPLKQCLPVLGVKHQTAMRWCREGRLRAVRIAGRYRIRRSELLRVASIGDADKVINDAKTL